MHKGLGQLWNRTFHLGRVHDVRNTYTTAALQHARGWHDLKVISERLGHEGVAITIDTFLRWRLPADGPSAVAGRQSWRR